MQVWWNSQPRHPAKEGNVHMAEDIRWKRRLSNYKKAFSQLTLFIEKLELNEFEQQGLIQFFEYTFELAWKTMKDCKAMANPNLKAPIERVGIVLYDRTSWSVHSV
jgi:hypothetical protein